MENRDGQEKPAVTWKKGETEQIVNEIRDRRRKICVIPDKINQKGRKMYENKIAKRGKNTQMRR